MIKRSVGALAASAALVAFAVCGLPSPAQASGPSAADPFCVLLLPEAGGTLVNRCGECREVTLERVRTGESVPNIRAMMLPAEAETPLPFRGPGRTRILGERTCPPPPGRNVSAAALGR